MITRLSSKKGVRKPYIIPSYFFSCAINKAMAFSKKIDTHDKE
jgi:hypothetical protein